VDFVDASIIRLARDESRAALFDDVSLAQLLAAAYDPTATADPPFAAVFDRIQVVFEGASVADVSGAVSTAGGSTHSVRLEATGIAGPPPARIDALWTGAIVGSAAIGADVVTEVQLRWPSVAGLDATIPGGLPADPIAREQARRQAFVALVRAGMSQPGLFDDAVLDHWLREHGVASVGELIAARNPSLHHGALRLSFSSQPATMTRTRFPFSAAILIRPGSTPISLLLAETRQARAHLDRLGLERPVDGGLRPRRSPIVIWMVPETTFDDADWPGADQPGLSEAQRRARRRIDAGRWLAREGIGLVVPPS
jgi:hypothetical protein